MTCLERLWTMLLDSSPVPMTQTSFPWSLSIAWDNSTSSSSALSTELSRYVGIIKFWDSTVWIYCTQMCEMSLLQDIKTQNKFKARPQEPNGESELPWCNLSQDSMHGIQHSRLSTLYYWATEAAQLAKFKSPILIKHLHLNDKWNILYLEWRRHAYINLCLLQQVCLSPA